MIINLVNQYKYRTELHCHTYPASQCADFRPREVVKIYAENGYDSIAVTNHFTPDIFNYEHKSVYVKKFLSDYNQALEAGKKYNINVILGMELRFTESENDYLIFGIDEEFVMKTSNYIEGSLESFYKSMKNEHNLIIQAHPFRTNCKVANPEYLDGVETFNMHPGHNSKNSFALKFAQENNLIQIVGTDFHHPGTECLAALLTKEPVRDSFDLSKVLKSKDYLFEIGGSIVIPYVR